MPYIVPSSVASTSSVTPPHSPSRPPLALSVALASPAPVPRHTPFTRPELPTSPGIAACENTARSLLSAAKEVAGHRHSPLHPPSLVKTMSNPATIAPLGTPNSKGIPSSSSIRRVVSVSDASPISNVYQYSNTTGNRLPHVPRRRTGGTSIPPEKQVEKTVVHSPSIPPRGRVRSRFVFGNEEGDGSGSGEECRDMTDVKATETRQRAERLPRKRLVSTERLLPKVDAPSRPSVTLEGASDGSSSDTEGSDCATPTPSRIAKSHRPHEQRPVQNGSASAEASVASVASLTQGEDDSQRFVFASNWRDEAEESRNETSTIEFPSMPPSPPPAVAVDNPTREITPFASPQQCTASKSFAGKRANAGSLRLDFTFGSASGESDGSNSERSRSGEHGRSLSESASLNSMPLIRKKSGEVVRSALRSRSSSASSARQRPSVSLGDISAFAIGSPSVSAPTTPSAATKMVHFDAQLERVKIFKSSSRPVAVSRDGSPTYDDTTSGGEADSASEGPSLSELVPRPRPRPRRLVPGGTSSEEEEALRRVLMMRVLNMPHREMEDDNADVRLEALHLADDAASVQGIVRVRNIAFEKSVAVRFTFDGWQTTSEVLGRWIESCIPRETSPPATLEAKAVATNSKSENADQSLVPAFDRFTFSIRLADLLLRISEKTLVLAIRYCTAGREMWDNNDGQNYRAVFERRPRHSLTLASSAIVPPNPDSANDSRHCDETGRKPSSAGGSSSSAGASDSVRVIPSGTSLLTSLDKAVTGAKEMWPPSPSKRPCDLALRYDLDSSLKNRSTWRPSFEQLRTWAGRDRDNTLSRAAMPWSRERPGGREATDRSTGAHPFKSHDLSFNNRAVAHGSPRDLDIDALDDSEVERYSRVRFAAAEEISSPDGTPLRRLNGGINRFVSPPMSFAFSGLGSEPHARNHHRSYFDSWAVNGCSTSNFGTGKARLTPPGTPRPLDPPTVSDFDAAASPTAYNVLSTTSAEGLKVSLSSRTYSFPPTIAAGNGSAIAGLGLMAGRPWSDKGLETRRNTSDSEASTPSTTSVSSPSTTASPSSPLDFPTLTPAVRVNPKTPGSTAMDATSYNAFLSSCCFYDGTQERLEIPPSEIRRTHSASEMQELLSTPPSSSEVFPIIKDSASLSSEIDSRTSTPTPSANTGVLSPGVVEPPPTSAALLETESGVSPRVRC